MNFFVEHAAPNLPPGAIADILDRLAWALSEDDIAMLEAVSMAWLIGQDQTRAEIALAREDSFPAHSRNELEVLMARVASQHPDLQKTAARMIERWDRQFPT